MRSCLRARLQQRADLVQALLANHEDSNAMLVVDAELNLLQSEQWERELGSCWERPEDGPGHAGRRPLPLAEADLRPAMRILCVLRSRPAR